MNSSILPEVPLPVTFFLKPRFSSNRRSEEAWNRLHVPTTPTIWGTGPLTSPIFKKLISQPPWKLDMAKGHSSGSRDVSRNTGCDFQESVKGRSQLKVSSRSSPFLSSSLEPDTSLEQPLCNHNVTVRSLEFQGPQT